MKLLNRLVNWLWAVDRFILYMILALVTILPTLAFLMVWGVRVMIEDLNATLKPMQDAKREAELVCTNGKLVNKDTIEAIQECISNEYKAIRLKQRMMEDDNGDE